jgi:signal transduction histidine kinase
MGKTKPAPFKHLTPAASIPARAGLEERTLILAPTGNDARLTYTFLAESGLPAHVCFDVPLLCGEIAKGCGAVILAEEVIGENSTSELIKTLTAQPSWSDLPIILITSRGEISLMHLRRLGIFGPGGNVTMLERPFRPATLISTVEVALRSRRRQYEARDRMEELKRAYDEVQRVSRAKDVFLAAVSHELRTPLNPALLIASEAARNYALPEETRLDFETIYKNIELEAHLIDDLLDMTRVTTGKVSLHRAVVNVHEILAAALATIEGDQQAKKITVKLKLKARHSLTDGDVVRLQQIFWNVLKNAVKFTPEHGTITVETSSGKQGQLIVKISDTGIGMNPDEIERIFSFFAQGDHASHHGSHRFGGLGLGLAISKNLVELHGGKIRGQSAGRGHGSTFIIELPLANENAVPEIKEASAHPQPVPTPHQPPRSILLVEDHETTRTTLAHLLNRRNYQVTTADSIAKARAIAQEDRFDLLISDIGLPDGSGNELMSELHEKYGLPGIALTGYGTEEDVSNSRAAGFLTHLVKPVQIQSLENALAAVEDRSD